VKILFVAAASSKIGLGHLKRCIAIADYAVSKNFETFFLISTDKDFANQISLQRHQSQLLDKEKSITAQLLAQKGNFDIAIVDVAFNGFLNSEFAIQALSLVSDIAHISIAIDSLGGGSIRQSLIDVKLTHLLIPYVTNMDFSHNTFFKVLCGAKYVILPVEFHGSTGGRANLGSGKSIMVTCGGSDPSANTLTVLEALEAIDEILAITVIIGPMFGKHLVGKINQLMASTKHKIVAVNSPDSLLPYMLKVDFAISASGLTKYELAAMGVPAILFSIDDEHHIANHEFATLGACVDLGLGFNKTSIKEAVISLMRNPDKRLNMSLAGKSSIDGMGIERFFNEILGMRDE
jgi:UDP-2,4-diacetamido-2,4,6-trideoxy-beta-L-altropyranose hydrolase